MIGDRLLILLFFINSFPLLCDITDIDISKFQNTSFSGLFVMSKSLTVSVPTLYKVLLLQLCSINILNIRWSRLHSLNPTLWYIFYKIVFIDPWALIHPTPVLLPGKSHGRRSLVGCSSWGREESDTTERLHFHFSLSCTGEGNGNPLQCSCLENPRDGAAWWAAVYGVAQSRTRLKRLSSSSSRALIIAYLFRSIFSESFKNSTCLVSGISLSFIIIGGNTYPYIISLSSNIAFSLYLNF